MPALATPLKGGLLADEMLQKNCNFAPQGAVKVFLGPNASAAALAQAQAQREAQQGLERMRSGADTDALLYLGPAASLTFTPVNPDFYLDEDYRAEINRQMQLRPNGRALPPIKIEYHAVTPSKWRQY